MTINVPELPESKIGMIENIAKTDVPIKIAAHSRKLTTGYETNRNERSDD